MYLSRGDVIVPWQPAGACLEWRHLAAIKYSHWQWLQWELIKRLIDRLSKSIGCLFGAPCTQAAVFDLRVGRPSGSRGRTPAAGLMTAWKRHAIVISWTTAAISLTDRHQSYYLTVILTQTTIYTIQLEPTIR